MASQLQLELERLTNQARFIQMIVDKTLVVSGRKRADVITDLRKKDFKPFPKIKKAKEVVEQDPTAEEEQEEEVTCHDDWAVIIQEDREMARIIVG